MTLLEDAPTRPPCKWLLKPQEDGSVEVWQGRKRIAVSTDMGFATRYIQDRLIEGDTVKTEDPDGYLTRVRLKRRRWRGGWR